MSAIHPIDYEKDPRYEQLLEEAREILFSSLGGYKPLPKQQVYVSTAAIRDTIAYWKSIQPALTKIKVKSEFYDNLVKAFPPITWSEADDIHGIRARFTGIPIEIDDDIEDDYEPVYGEENTK